MKGKGVVWTRRNCQSEAAIGPIWFIRLGLLGKLSHTVAFEFLGFKSSQRIQTNELERLLHPIVADDVGSDEPIAYDLGSSNPTVPNHARNLSDNPK